MAASVRGAEPRAASALASVWFTAYPPSRITGPGESVLENLGHAELWRVFRDIGIGGVHTGPMKLAGGWRRARVHAHGGRQLRPHQQ